MLGDSTRRRFSCSRVNTKLCKHAQMDQMSWHLKVKKLEHFQLGIYPLTEKITTMLLKEEADGSVPAIQPQTEEDEARNDFGEHIQNWCFSASRPRGEGVRLYVLEAGSFSVAHNYIDFVRWMNTTLDVLLASRIDDCWNVDGDWSCRGRGLTSKFPHVDREILGKKIQTLASKYER